MSEKNVTQKQNTTKEEAKELFIPLMLKIKPEENTEFQINYIEDSHQNKKAIRNPANGF